MREGLAAYRATGALHGAAARPRACSPTPTPGPGSAQKRGRLLAEALAIVGTVWKSVGSGGLTGSGARLLLGIPGRDWRSEARLRRGGRRSEQGASIGSCAPRRASPCCGDQGKPEARDLLAPVYGWFTEGFDTPDLRRPSAARRAPGGEPTIRSAPRYPGATWIAGQDAMVAGKYLKDLVAGARNHRELPSLMAAV